MKVSVIIQHVEDKFASDFEGKEVELTVAKDQESKLSLYNDQGDEESYLFPNCTIIKVKTDDGEQQFNISSALIHSLEESESGSEEKTIAIEIKPSIALWMEGTYFGYFIQANDVQKKLKEITIKR